MSSMPEQHLQEALALLPWLERSCLLLSMNTDFTQEEIASILNVTEEEVSIATLQGREQFDHAYRLVSGTWDRLDLSHINFVPDASEEALITTLQDSVWEKRVVAVKTIGEIKSEEHIELLKKALQDIHKAVRAIATRVLGDLGALTPVELLIETLQDPCWEVRVEGAYALGKIEARRVPQEHLIQLLRDENAAVRVASVWALGHRGKPSPLEQLINVFLHDYAWEVRIATILALGNLREWTCLQTLSSKLEEEDAQVIPAIKAVLQQRDHEPEVSTKRIPLELANPPESLPRQQSERASEGSSVSISLSAGQKLGQYVLVKQIGRGGRAQVFLAHHCTEEERMTAIKIPLNSKVNQAVFLEEARILNQLRHPHILRAYDANVEQGLPYIVTDYIAGGTLRERYPLKTHLPVKQVIAYIKALANALEYTHNHGIVHGDVKPENVLIGMQGEIVLCDFGAATNLNVSQPKPTIVGTRRYMAPEQFEKQNLPASDQYALAVIAWELLNGVNTSIDAIREEMVQKACSEPPLQGSLPLTVRSVLLKALSKVPQQRFDSIASFAVALESALQDLDWNELLWGDRASVYPSLGDEVTRTTERIAGPWDPNLPGSGPREPIESDTQEEDADSAGPWNPNLPGSGPREPIESDAQRGEDTDSYVG